MNVATMSHCVMVVSCGVTGVLLKYDQCWYGEYYGLRIRYAKSGQAGVYHRG